jgi:hypothetical protein
MGKPRLISPSGEETVGDVSLCRARRLGNSSDADEAERSGSRSPAHATPDARRPARTVYLPRVPVYGYLSAIPYLSDTEPRPCGLPGRPGR